MADQLPHWHAASTLQNSKTQFTWIINREKQAHLHMLEPRTCLGGRFGSTCALIKNREHFIHSRILNWDFRYPTISLSCIKEDDEFIYLKIYRWILEHDILCPCKSPMDVIEVNDQSQSLCLQRFNIRLQYLYTDHEIYQRVICCTL